MVCLAVHTLDRRPVECRSLDLILKGSVALERAAFVEAGCFLREAVRLYLLAECEYHDCTPTPRKPGKKPCSQELAVVLKKRKVIEPSLYKMLMGYVDLGNRAAHLAFVKPGELSSGFNIMCMILDDARHLVQPKAGGRV